MNFPKRRIKITLIVLSFLVVGLVLAVFLSELYLERNLARLINSNQERLYNIDFEDIDIDKFVKGFVLENATIYPVKKSGNVNILSVVDEIVFEGFSWKKLIFDKSVDVERIVFSNPKFNVNILSDSTNISLTDSAEHEKTSNGFQYLFGDILSRAKINDFQIINGKIAAFSSDENTGSNEIARIESLNLYVDDIQTDSVQLEHLIPFKVKDIQYKTRGIYYRINGYTDLKVDEVKIDFKNAQLKVKDLKFEFNRDWTEVSNEIKKQIDLITFSIDSLDFKNIDTGSKLFNSLDIRAHNLDIYGLNLTDRKDNRYNRPPDEEKPMFKGLIDLIPVALKIDTIKIIKSQISYTEFGKDRLNYGTITFDNLYASIYDVTSINEFKNEYEEVKVDIIANINSNGNLNFKLKIPYDEEKFHLFAELDSLNLTSLNKSLIPLAGIEIKSGNLNHLRLVMNASRESSDNFLDAQYQNLGIRIYEEINKDSLHNKSFLSFVANTMLHTNNTPEHGHYSTTTFSKERNIYRAPFQHIVVTLMEGFMDIMPTSTAKFFLRRKKHSKKS